MGMIANPPKVDPREDKLPKWAQDSIQQLRRAVADRDDRLASRQRALTEPPIGWLDEYEDSATPVGWGHGAIRFGNEKVDGIWRPVERNWLDVRTDRRAPGLYVLQADTQIHLIPQVTNVVAVKVGRE